MNKKVLVGSIASLALAMVPMMGVFAATTQTDTISVTIGDNCALSRKAFTNGGASGNTTHINGTDGTWSTDTLSATRSNSTVTTALGGSQYNVVCNNVAGYKVTVAVSKLSYTVSGTEKANIPANTNYSASASGWSPLTGCTVGSSSPYTFSCSSATKVANGATVSTASSATAGTSFIMGYGVGISSTQAAGTYSGTAVYTLTKL